MRKINMRKDEEKYFLNLVNNKFLTITWGLKSKDIIQQGSVAFLSQWI